MIGWRGENLSCVLKFKYGLFGCLAFFYNSHDLNMLIVFTLHINLVEMKFAKKML